MLVALRHACCSVEALSTYGLTHVISTGSTCVLVLARGCKERATDHPPQQVKQHGLSLLYREESSPHTASPPRPLPPDQLVNNADMLNATAALAHALKDTCPSSKGILQKTQRCLETHKHLTHKWLHHLFTGKGGQIFGISLPLDKHIKCSAQFV